MQYEPVSCSSQMQPATTTSSADALSGATGTPTLSESMRVINDTEAAEEEGDDNAEESLDEEGRTSDGSASESSSSGSSTSSDDPPTSGTESEEMGSAYGRPKSRTKARAQGRACKQGGAQEHFIQAEAKGRRAQALSKGDCARSYPKPQCSHCCFQAEASARRNSKRLLKLVCYIRTYRICIRTYRSRIRGYIINNEIQNICRGFEKGLVR